MLHQVAQQLADTETDHYYTAYYGNHPVIRFAINSGLLDRSIMGGEFRRRTEAYFAENGLVNDYRGASHDYDFVVTSTDMVIQSNIRGKKIVLVQEGMTDPEGIMYHIVKRLRLPRYLGSTAATGLSDAYIKFCVASEGYADHFARKGVKREKMVVTGIPNYDNVAQFLDNDFPYRNYVLVATSDIRETFGRDDRKGFIRKCQAIANGRQLIFKLHPNEIVERAVREIERYAPGALVMTGGKTEHMIANCDVLITQYSTVVYIGLALGKEVHSYFNVDELRKMTPLQNGGRSAYNIAQVIKQHL